MAHIEAGRDLHSALPDVKILMPMSFANDVTSSSWDLWQWRGMFFGRIVDLERRL
jgi:hypothetical protein